MTAALGAGKNPERLLIGAAGPEDHGAAAQALDRVRQFLIEGKASHQPGPETGCFDGHHQQFIAALSIVADLREATADKTEILDDDVQVRQLRSGPACRISSASRSPS